MTRAVVCYIYVSLIAGFINVVYAALLNTRLKLSPTKHVSTSIEERWNEPIWARKGTAQSCGDSLCVCYGRVANCSGHSKGLPYVPSLPSNLKALYLDRNNITSIEKESFFSNVSRMQYITLRENGLQTLKSIAFQMFLLPFNLSLDNNIQFSYTGLSQILGIRNLYKLSCYKCGLGEIPHGLFTLSPLHVLFLMRNRLGIVRMTEFKTMHNLQIMSLSQSKIYYLSVDAKSNVMHFSLRENSLNEFPKTCDQYNRSLFPHLVSLVLSQNSIDSVPDRVCLPSLESLELSQNRFLTIPSNTFQLDKFPVLTGLYISNMIMYLRNMTIDSFAFNNSALLELELEENNLYFDNSRLVHKDAFCNCRNLTHLVLSRNVFSFSNSSDYRFLQLFGHLNLSHLSMKDTQLSTVNALILSKFKHLQILELGHNKLTVIPEATFDALFELKTLYLDDNLLTVILPTTFGQATRNRLTTLDLSFNPFECCCQMLWFKSWRQTRPDQFPNLQTGYVCQNDKVHSVYTFDINIQACLLSHQMYLFITIFSTFFLLFFTLSVLTYRYRWHMRLVMYEAFRGRSDVRRRRLLMDNFDYDVFVSYDTDDQGWVTGHLMPHLEQRLGLRLCVHQRDFVVGKYIVDNIADSVERSKMVMMVFSNSFAKSQWCQFELSLCLRHVMDLGDDLLIVCLGDVVSRDLSSAMRAVLKTTTYIQWVGTEPDAVRAFWGRLEIALRDIITYLHA